MPCRTLIALVCFLLGSASARAGVDPAGGFATSVSIEVPPFRGITPHVGLSYHSNAGDGLVGVGWRLEGFSVIERSRPRRGVPRYASGDTFLIDGAELLPCAGASPGCANGGTHATRVESFQRIAYDAAADTWTVWSKDGTRTRYRSLIRRPGTTTTFRWGVESVTDTHGNSVSYAYDCPSSTACYPRTITYGEGKACGFSDAPPGAPVPGGTIQLRWEPRSDVVTYALGGGLVETRMRLASIDVRMHQGRLSVYDLRYAVSASSGSSVLTGVQRFGDDAVLDATGHVVSGTAMPATSFTTPSVSVPRGSWLADSGSGASTNTLPWNAAPYAEGPFSGNTPQLQPTPTSTPAQTRVADVNGDGRDDTIILSVRRDATTGLTHQVLGTALATPTGYSFRTFDPDPAGNTPDLGIHEDFLVGDATGDGMADILQIRNDSVLEVWESLGDGNYTRRVSQPVPWPVTATMPSSFSFGASLGATIAPFTAAFSFHFFTLANLDLEEQFFVADVDGDLRADFVQIAHDAMNASVIIRVAISTGDGFTILPDFSAPWRWSSVNTKKNRFFPADLNGDGRTDLVHIGRHEGGLTGDLSWEHATIEVALSQGNGTFTFGGSHNGSLWNDDDQWFPGDFDGDAKTDIGHVSRMAPHGAHTKDHVYLRVAYSNGMGGFTWGGADTDFRWWRTSPCLDTQLYPNTFMTADVNGDARSDLVVTWEPTGDCAAPRLNVAVAFARPNDTFELRPTFRTNVRDWAMRDEIGIHTADVNGDRKADLVTTRWRFPGNQAPITVQTLVSPNVAEDYQNWQATELDGDGRTDFYYVYFMNPGYRISTLRRTASGFVRADTTVLPDATMPGLDDPHTAGWLAADVGGPAGVPDGRVDLVQVDASRWRVNTLLSLGDGAFTKVSSTPYLSPLPAVFAANWRLADVDGDDLADLVNIEPTRPGVRVRTLIAAGNGTFLPRASQHFVSSTSTPFGAYTGEGGFKWRTADLDDDGLTDLVATTRHFDGATFATAVYTLLSTGTGWEERSWRGGPGFVDVWRFVPAELNGDGATDLAYVEATASGPTLHTLTSLGDGSFKAATQSFTLSDPSVQWIDAQMFKPVDLDRDGRSELVHFGAFRNPLNAFMLGAVTLWNRGGSFRVESTPVVAAWGADAARARLADGNGDGRPDIVLPHYGVVSASVFLPSDRVSDIANGMGGTTSIGYTTSAGAHSFVPAGLLQNVVSSVTVKDSVNPSSTDHVSHYTLEGLTWSSRERRLLGFANVTTRDTRTVRATTYELSEACGARAASSVLRDPFGTVIQRTATKYVAPGNAPPFLCLMRDATQSECEGAQTCRDTAIAYTYDFDTGRGDFGNIVVTEELGDVADRDDDRRIETSFVPNTNDWLVGFTATREVFGISNGSWRLSSSVRYGYDYKAYTDGPVASGDLTQVSTWDDALGRYVDETTSYDGRGNVEKQHGPGTRWNLAGKVTTYTYDCTFGLFPTQACDDLHCRELVWNLNRGKPQSVTDANGQTTTFAYDALGRETNVYFPDGGETRTDYPQPSDWGTTAQHVRQSRVDGSPRDGVLWTERYFDGLGRTRSIVKEGGRAKDFVYFEATDLLASSSSAYFLRQGPSSWTSYTYDAAHRPSTMRLPDGAMLRYAHELGQLTVTNPVGASKIYLSDGFGRIVEIREEIRVCKNGREECTSKWTSTRYTYDTAGRVSRVTDDVGNVTSLEWTSRGMARKTCDPDRGCQLATYDEAGAVESTIDALGQTMTHEYDVLGRPTVSRSIDRGGGTQREVTYWYDVDPSTGQPSGASIGRRTGYDDRATTIDGSERYTYDVAGRVTLTNKCVEGICYAWEQLYDIAGRPGDLIYPDGEIVTTRYDRAGLITEVVPYVRDATYDAEERPEVITFGTGAVERYEYDAQRGWLSGASIEDAFGAPLFKAYYTRDRAGRPETSMEENHQPIDAVYGYDSFDRLTSVTASDPRYDELIDYDTIGNITGNLRNGVYAYGDPQHVHAVTGTNNDFFKYDSAGNLRVSNTLEIDWNVENLPSDITNTAAGTRVFLDYDANGGRVKKSSMSGKRYWFGGLVEQDARGAFVKNYFMGGRRIARDNGRDKTFFHADQVGNVRVTTDDRGLLQNRYDYAAFGDVIDRTEVITNDFELAGRDTDDETGLVFMGARYYHPSLGKFVSADTLVPDVINPQAYNRYSYVYNDPISYTDPTGHQPVYQSTIVQDPNMPGWPKVILVPSSKPEPKTLPRAKPLAAPASSAIATVPEVVSTPVTQVAGPAPSAPPLVQADVPFNPAYDPEKLAAFWEDRRLHPRRDVMREAEYVVAGAIMAPVVVFAVLEAAPPALLVAIGDGGAFLAENAANGVAMIARQRTIAAGIQGAGADAWMQIYKNGLSENYDYKRMALSGFWTAMSFRMGGFLHGPGGPFFWDRGAALGTNVLRFAMAQPVWFAYGRGVSFLNSYLRNVPVGPQSATANCSNVVSAVRAFGESYAFSTPWGQRVFPGGFQNPGISGFNVITGNIQWQACSAKFGEESDASKK